MKDGSSEVNIEVRHFFCFLSRLIFLSVDARLRCSYYEFSIR